MQHYFVDILLKLMKIVGMQIEKKSAMFLKRKIPPPPVLLIFLQWGVIVCKIGTVVKENIGTLTT